MTESTFPLAIKILVEWARIILWNPVNVVASPFNRFSFGQRIQEDLQKVCLPCLSVTCICTSSLSTSHLLIQKGNKDHHECSNDFSSHLFSSESHETYQFFCIFYKLCLLPGPSGRFWVARSQQIPSAAGRVWCPQWSIAPVEAIFEIWLWAAVKGRAPGTRTSWPCFRRKAVSLPAGEPESLPWSFSKAQILWQDGSQSFHQPLNRPQAKEETRLRANPMINEQRQS